MLKNVLTIVTIKVYVKMVPVFAFLDSKDLPAEKKRVLTHAPIMEYVIKMVNVNAMLDSKEMTVPFLSVLIIALITELAKIISVYAKKDTMEPTVVVKNAPTNATETDFVEMELVTVTKVSWE